jgi:hypothetical protein
MPRYLTLTANEITDTGWRRLLADEFYCVIAQCRWVWA